MKPEPINPQAGNVSVLQTTDGAPAVAERQSPYLRIFKSNVFVRDHERALKFYTEQLGFSVLAESRFEFGRWVAIAPPDGSAILAVVAPKRGLRELQADWPANADCVHRRRYLCDVRSLAEPRGAVSSSSAAAVVGRHVGGLLRCGWKLL